MTPLKSPSWIFRKQPDASSHTTGASSNLLRGASGSYIRALNVFQSVCSKSIGGKKCFGVCVCVSFILSDAL